MRITNPMMTNRMLLNMTRNAINVDSLYNQIATGKKISFPSDNPILASRALKFRTNVSETEQYKKNVAQGLSWMEVSEAAFKNVHNIMDKIRDLAERGATGTLTFEDRQKIITEIASLTDQIGLEMNATYAGRYIFSGYRTDEAPTIIEDNATMKYRITQYFTNEDIEHTKAYTQIMPDLNAAPQILPGASTVKDVQVIKLAYNIVDGKTGIDFISPPIAAANIKSINDHDAYEAGNFIKETGEYVVQVTNTDGTISSSVPLPTAFTYEKTGFLKGELNPKVYFNSMDLSGLPAVPPTSAMTDVALEALGVKHYNIGFGQNPPVRQELELEFSIGTRVKINSSAADIFSDKLYADLQALVQKTLYVNRLTKDQIRTDFEMNGLLSGEDLENHVALETQKIQETIQSRLRDMIGLADMHMSRISREHTDMGTRMSRLELIDSRLSDDRVSYSKLLSENEDTDYMETMMNLNVAESVYQASLHAGANIMKITLADYI